MNVHDYLIDHSDIDWADVLSPWSCLLPPELTVWLMNRFGDLFVVLDNGTVHMLDVGGGTLEQVGDSRDAFCTALDQRDNATQWLMIPLVDRLVGAGKLLRPGHCYSYVLSPVLGGDYTVENTMVIPIHEHYSLHASIHEQIKDLPDGAAVRIRIGRRPGESKAESP